MWSFILPTEHSPPPVAFRAGASQAQAFMNGFNHFVSRFSPLTISSAQHQQLHQRCCSHLRSRTALCIKVLIVLHLPDVAISYATNNMWSKEVQSVTSLPNLLSHELSFDMLCSSIASRCLCRRRRNIMN